MGVNMKIGDGRGERMQCQYASPRQISKVENYNCPYHQKGQSAPPCQLLCRSVELLRRYGRFSIIKMAAVRHLGFLKVVNFNCPYPSECKNTSTCQILLRSVKPFRRYLRFWFSKWWPSAILDLLYACFGHMRSVIWWSLSLCEIWFESVL